MNYVIYSDSCDLFSCFSFVFFLPFWKKIRLNHDNLVITRYYFTNSFIPAILPTLKILYTAYLFALILFSCFVIFIILDII